MAQAILGGFTGAVSSFINSVFGGCNFTDLRLSLTHPTGDATGFADTVAGSRNKGSGCITLGFTASGPLIKGTTPAPNLGGTGAQFAASATTTIQADGSACQWSGNAVISGADVTIVKRNAVSIISFSAVFDGAITETWATS